ncbi:MAG: class I SAM-dependent methyltransferase [Nitrososphaerota archaeon]|nr:class I SAM-dependent methyltransferase [Candidatus Bathyarchaeota archaeon]MDW8024093.1 class I SAM-dependent methyltransferase [Nitrososphaerota archaeon]
MDEWSQKRETMQHYDLTSQTYDMQYAEEQAAKIEAAMKSVKLEKQSIVLDVGCGTGLLFNYVANQAKMVLGLDISRKILNEARKKAEKFGNVYLVLADADHMPIKAGAFSHVFAITLIQNMPNPEKTLAEARRVSARTAILVVTGLKKKFSLEAFKELLRKSGLSIIEVMDGDEHLKCYVAVCRNTTSILPE